MIDKKPLIIAENLTKSFNKIEVVKNLSTNFNEAERIALIGQNGAGKTSLIRCMLGHYVYGGKLSVLGYEPRTQRVDMLKDVGFVPQIPPPLKMTVSEMLDFFTKITKTPKQKFIDISYNLGLQVKENMNKAFLSLSGGMKQKLLVAFAIGREPKILLLDEPSANLDPDAREILFKYLDEFDKNSLMILSSHRMNEISTLVNRLIEMDLGEIVLDEHLDSKSDYSRSFAVLPKGVGSEIFSFKALEQSYKYGDKENHKEHVNEYIEENEEKFKISELEVTQDKNRPEISLTVDTPDDYKKACFIVENSKNKYITTKEVIELCLRYA